MDAKIFRIIVSFYIAFNVIVYKLFPFLIGLEIYFLSFYDVIWGAFKGPKMQYCMQSIEDFKTLGWRFTSSAWC